MMLNKKIITYELCGSLFKNRKSYENYIYNMVVTNKIKKIKKDLYALINPLTNNIYAYKYEIASSISNTSYISYHSALEYYGLANQVYSYVIVSSITRFRNFEFDGIDYNFKSTNNSYMVNEISHIKVTSLEKTIIDCIDRIDLAGGIDELLEALDLVEYVDEKELLKALDFYNKKILYRKAGYILSFYKDDLNLSNTFFEMCYKHVNNNKFYFLDEEYYELEFDKKWNLFVPKNLFNFRDGGIIDELY